MAIFSKTRAAMRDATEPETPAVPVAVVALEAPKLTRRAVELILVGEDRLRLAQQASEVLGYKPLLALTVQEHVKAVLAKLGIEPLDIEAVKAYKDFKVHGLNREMRAKYGPDGGYACWDITPLETYRSPVPEFVLSHALEIKQNLPEAKFLVDELSYHPDPFLVLVVEGVRWYIDVWDEPKFEGRRTV